MASARSRAASSKGVGVGAAGGAVTAGNVEAAACGTVDSAGVEGSIGAGVLGFWFGDVTGSGGGTTIAGLDVDGAFGVSKGALG
jgi:hypothetical protein